MSTLIIFILLPDLDLLYPPLVLPVYQPVLVYFLVSALAPELELMLEQALAEQVVLPVPAVIL